MCAQKNQEEYYSGKKKRHTLKSQITADAASGEIYSVEGLSGRVHDFELCKETLLQVLMSSVVILTDSDDQGIHTYYEWSLIPMKKSKNHLLSEWEKSYNRELSRRRVMIEDINAKNKVFKMMSYPYRNRRQSHLARTRLVCAIINRENKQKERL